MTVLPAMKCPYRIEPHQIQGLDFINVFPVVQWLVKRSVENRAAKASRLSAFAVSQFHNHFRLESERGQPERHARALLAVRQVQQQYGPRRQYKRRDAGPDDERTRVRITLLEYGNCGLFAPRLATPTSAAAAAAAVGTLPPKGKELDGDNYGEADMVANEVTTVLQQKFDAVRVCWFSVLCLSTQLFLDNRLCRFIACMPSVYTNTTFA